MSNLYNLLESENISSDLKVDILYKIAENLGEEITEEDISELDKSFNLFGHTIDIKKQNKTPDAFDVAQEIHKKSASEPEAPKTEATKRSIRAPKVIGLLRRSRDAREAVLKKYGRNKAEEAPKVEATAEAPKTEKVKDNVIKGDFSKPKDSYAKTVQYMSSDNKTEAPKTEAEPEAKVEAPKKKSSTKIGKAIGKAISKKAGSIVNDEVTTVKAPKKGGKKK